MKEMSLEEKKGVGFEILCKIAEICDKWNIDYYLAYGTLLGAIRHKGFIPWDDDIDIWVKQEDYLCLLKHLKKETEYDIKDPFRDMNWPLPFAKVCDKKTIVKDNNTPFVISRGIAVDIFMLSPHSINPQYKIALYKPLLIFEYVGRTKQRHSNNEIKSGIKKGLYFLTRRCLHASYIKIKLYCVRIKKGKKNLVSCYDSPYCGKDIHNIKSFEKDTALFCGKTFQIPSGYDKVLRKLYGDYMNPPPLEKRVSNHNVISYWS